MKIKTIKVIALVGREAVYFTMWCAMVMACHYIELLYRHLNFHDEAYLLLNICTIILNYCNARSLTRTIWRLEDLEQYQRQIGRM